MAGRPMRAITFAMVNVLPEPVTPSSVWNDRPSSIPSTSVAIAVGWSPAGGYGWYSWNGEPSNLMNLDSSRVSSVSSSGVSDMRERCLGREQTPILAVRARAGLDGRIRIVGTDFRRFVPGFRTFPCIFKMGRPYQIASDCFDE